MFIDELKLYVESGKGGNGCVHFRREKYVARGGPDGGDGGKGGDVVVEVAPEYNTLMPLRNCRHYRAEPGGKGRGSNMSGAMGPDLILKVPRGTMVREFETGTLLANLTQPGQTAVIAKGGKGGKGNAHFTSSTHQAPKFAQSGGEGEGLWVVFELKMMADVGLVGFPNAGKSTLIRQISGANPKVADYPFTTLKPSLGVVEVDEWNSFVMADIPGIIEGAHEGAGLGHQFLRHIERTRVLLLLIDPTDPERDVEPTYEALIHELNQFSDLLQSKRKVVAVTKCDLESVQEEQVQSLKARLDREQIPFYEISSFNLKVLNELVYDLHKMIQEEQLSAPEDPIAEIESEEVPIKETVTEESGLDPLDEL